MKHHIVPAGADHVVVISDDPEEPISVQDVRGGPYPYSETVALLGLDAAAAIGEALLDAVRRARPERP